MPAAPLYGDPAANAKVWSRYAVLLGGLTADTPTHPAAFTLNNGSTTTDQWDPVGALAEDSPFGDGEESISPSDHTAAGFGVYATTYSNQKETITFSAKETTLVTLGLIYDASDLDEASGTISGTLKQRDPLKKYLLAFQRVNSTEMERRTTKNYACIESISKTVSNNETVCQVTAAVYPTANKELYDYYLGPLS